MDLLSFMLGKAAGGGGGGSSITVEALSATENKTYTAPAGKAYSPVVVNVANSYSAGDEGKVVSNGALVAQTAHAKVTQNGTIDTTLNNSVEVDVSGGGGASNVVIGSFTVPNTTDTIETISIDYTGEGYPIALIMAVDGGMYNSNDANWYGTLAKYAIGQVALTKDDFSTAPAYNGTALKDGCALSVVYKNNASDGTQYNQSFGKNALFFRNADPGYQVNSIFQMTDAKTIKYRTHSTDSYGLLQGIKYWYCVVYSS